VTRRLLVSYLGLAVLILVILEVPLATLAQRFERNLAADQAVREASGLAAVAAEDFEKGPAGNLQSLVSAYQARTLGEVSVVSLSGQVIAASAAGSDDESVEWHQLVSSALAGQSASLFAFDEHQPVAVAAVPIASDVSRRPFGAVVLSTPAMLTENRIHQIWIALGGFAAVAMFAAAVVGVLLARSVSRPLARLESAVNRIGGGDLSARASELRGPPQIRSLATQFNQMASRLDELVEAQQRFVADASHQLRSPLTALRLRLENLEVASGPNIAEGAAAAGHEVQRLSRIVDGLLTLGRAGQDQPEARPVDVDEVIEQRCDAWSALARERQVELQWQHGGRPSVNLMVPGDLDQILDNLLANALDVSPPGSAIRVYTSTAASGGTEVHVSDQGPGMNETDRRHAFDRFWQGRSSGGHSGLGLAIVHQLAQRNGATVELRQSQPAGLDAVLEVPASGARARRPQPVPGEQAAGSAVVGDRRRGG
jgi:signal transduction histidine kinase